MAKRTKKAAGTDFPPLYMLVEKGRLVPAFQPDYERLSSYKDGTRIVCHIEPDGVRKGIRNWYRIIGAACSKGLIDLSKTAADELLRGALDMVVDKRMANGKWVEERQSLNDLDDAELEEKVELMKGVLLAWTGIDPDTFDREIGGSVGDENFASDVNKEGFARSPAADTAKTVEGEGGADSSSPETESGTAATSPESNTSGEAPAAAPASTPNAGSGGTSIPIADKQAEKISAAFDLMETMIAAIPDDVKPGEVGNCKCPNPNCNGTLKWSRAKSNGHAAVQCMKAIDDGRGNIMWERGCFGPLMLSMDRDAVWPRPKQSPASEGVGQHAPAKGSPAGDGGAPGSNGLAATDEPGLRPEDRAWLLTATRALLPVAKEGMSRGDINKVARDNINMMPKGIEKVAATAMDHIMQHVYRVAKGDEQLDWEQIATLAHTTVKDLAELE